MPLLFFILLGAGIAYATRRSESAPALRPSPQNMLRAPDVLLSPLVVPPGMTAPYPGGWVEQKPPMFTGPGVYRGSIPLSGAETSRTAQQVADIGSKLGFSSVSIWMNTWPDDWPMDDRLPGYGRMQLVYTPIPGILSKPEAAARVWKVVPPSA